MNTPTMPEIKPDALYWATFARFELRLPGQCVTDCSASGSVDDAVAFWVPLVREQVARDAFQNAPDAVKIRCELREYGAWSDEELRDNEQNWHRLVWIAACNISEESEPDYSEPVK